MSKSKKLTANSQRRLVNNGVQILPGPDFYFNENF